MNMDAKKNWKLLVFNNHVVVYKDSNRTELIDRNSSVKTGTYETKSIHYNSNVSYFVIPKEQFNKDDIYIENKLEKPVTYKLQSDKKFKQEITSEEYDKLSEQYKRHYKSDNLEDVYEKHNLEIINTLEFDLDYYEPDSNSNDTILADTELISDIEWLGVIPSRFNYLFPQTITPKGVFDYLKARVESLDTNRFRYAEISTYYGSVKVSYYESEFTFGTKPKEIMKQNGRPYATPKYTQVLDIPKVIDSVVFVEKTLPSLRGRNKKDALEKLGLLVDNFISDLQNKGEV